MRQEDNEVLFSQIGQDMKRLEQRLERVEDFMNQYYKNKINTFDLDNFSKPFDMGQACECGGRYWSTTNMGYDTPNAKCNKCGKETTLCPSQRLEIKEEKEIKENGICR